MKRTREDREPLGPALPLATPWVINVDPASACNFKCGYCFQSSGDMKTKGIMQWSTYKRIIKDIGEFDKPIKTLRLYAFGEPLLNPHFAKMVKYAKDKGVCGDIDTTTNASQLTKELICNIIDAGLDRINISIVGMNSEQYKKFSNAKVDFDRLVENISYLYENRRKCTVFIKINRDLISSEDASKFYKTFKPIADGVALEHVMDCWYDVNMAGVETNRKVGVYGQPLTYVNVCPYIFYSFCVQFDGEVSPCFLDWNRKLVVGDIREESLRDIWNGYRLNDFYKVMLLGQRKHMYICKSCNQLVAGQPVNIDHIADELIRNLP